MKRALFLVTGFVLVLGLAAGAEASLTKSLFSEQSASIGLQVTILESDDDFAQLTFANHPIDGAILNDAATGDSSIGWDVLFGPLLVDRTSRAIDGSFAVWDLVVPAQGDTLTVQDGVNVRLNADVSVGKLFTKVGGNFGGMDAPGGLDVKSIAYADSGVFEEYSNFPNLDWGFAYTGLDLDSYLQTPPDYSGFAATAGYIQVPEPVTIGLMVLGTGALAAARRRRK